LIWLVLLAAQRAKPGGLRIAFEVDSSYRGQCQTTIINIKGESYRLKTNAEQDFPPHSITNPKKQSVVAQLLLPHQVNLDVGRRVKSQRLLIRRGGFTPKLD
jgi:hypothetical protein